MKRLKFLFFLVWLLPVFGCEEKDLEKTFDFSEEVTDMEINVDSLDLLVEPSDDGTSFVDIDMKYRGRKPDYNVSVSGNTLKVKVDCHFRCDGRLSLKVPATTASNIKVDSGSMQIKYLQGDANLSVDSGNIKLTEVFGDLDIDVDSGGVSGTVNSTVCFGDVDSGTFSLHFNQTPNNLDISADSGNIKLKIPSGPYNVTTSIDSGSLSIDSVTIDDDAPNAIHAEVDSGKITIEGY